MKVAAALRLKNDYNLQLIALKHRIMSNLVVEEGQEPDESPKKLIALYHQVSQNYQALVTKINLHNSSTTVEYPSYHDNYKSGHLIGDLFSNDLPPDLVSKEKYIVQALVERESLKAEIQTFRSILDRSKVSRSSTRDILKVAVLDVQQLQKKIDTMAKFLRIMDAKIQEHNWLQDLKEI
ncbi:hypothetical protein CAAN1_09S02300 [[Candida] anglica]|uniref:Uncharacterized protein n=1 Tax=[Candida] anglica TaxID=148631 RepID=A0ABP0EBU7_9ASCO